ncbi:MAG TPA: RluA family pseudouridine synthase [Stellaceae bacterium]|nr:RluA family pseudouridine synthase [Stellaceae bacterium]
MPETITVTDQDGDIRLDRWFRRHYPGVPHGRLEKLLRTGQVRIDGRRAKAGDRVAPGMAIRVPPLAAAAAAERTAPAPRPQDERLLRDLVIYRDDHAIVINKPPGLAVQGGSNTARHIDGMLDALRFGAVERPRLVHRLDKDTSGVLLLARGAAAAAFFTRAFRDKTARKVYWAVVAGLPELRRGRIDLALAKGLRQGRERVQPDEDGKDAVTYYAVVDAAGDKAAWLALMPLTGRTHQLRAHCAALGTPILSDGKYGGTGSRVAGVPGTNRLHLHARALAIPHPAGFTLEVEAPLPPHMQRVWGFLGFAADAGDPFAGLDLPA